MEDTEKKGKIFISYKQINNFLFNKDKKIASFDLYVTTKNNSLKIDYNIDSSVNMIHNKWNKDNFVTNLICKIKYKKSA